MAKTTDIIKEADIHKEYKAGQVINGRKFQHNGKWIITNVDFEILNTFPLSTTTIYIQKL